MTDQFKTTVDFTVEERKQLLQLFYKSGLTDRQFSEQNQILPKTFKRWLFLDQNPNLRKKKYSPTEKKKIIEAYLSSDMSSKVFCGAWGLGTSSLNEWVKRYEAEGSDGLMRRAHGVNDRRLGMKVPLAVRNEILEIKKKEPQFGFEKIKQWMFRFKGVQVSKGTIRKTIKNEGLPLAMKKRKNRRAPDKIKRFERAKPMQLWQSDITQFTLGPSSMRVYLTIFMDDHSRYIVGWRLQSKQTADLVLDAFQDAMVRFGKPEEVLTDQGRQYFAWRGKSELEKLLEKENIKHVVSRAHHPQTLGKCERFWETVYNEFWTRAKPQDLEEARLRLKYFFDHYNHQRPHQGISGMTPADRFFGVAEEVRDIIEKTVSENSLRLAIDELPKPPAFLIGQVGDQRISFHGTSGKFYLTQENMLGVEDESGIERNRSSVAGYGIKSDDEKVQNQKATIGEKCTQVKSEFSSNTSERFVGPGDRRTTWTSEDKFCENNRELDGLNYESRSFEAISNASDPVLADVESSIGRVNGGTADSAESSR